MNCPKCKMIEMRVEVVKDGIMQYVCRKCGETLEKTLEKVEEEESE